MNKSFRMVSTKLLTSSATHDPSWCNGALPLYVDCRAPVMVRERVCSFPADFETHVILIIPGIKYIA